MDSLGGILIGGLLGNSILGKYGLFGGLITIEIVDTGAAGVGGNTTNLQPPHRKQKDKQIIITLRFNDNITRKTYTVSDRFARISINILGLVSKIGISIKSIFIRNKKISETPTVRIRDDRD